MQPKEQFGVVVRSIGLLALIAGVLGVIEWLANDSGQQLMESSALLVIGFSFLAAPAEISDWAYKAEKSRNEDA